MQCHYIPRLERGQAPFLPSLNEGGSWRDLLKRVSALIPAYNEGERIEGTVKALREIGPDWEILVIDDGSSDDTAARAAGAGATVLRLERNQGKGGALEAGLDHTRGEILLLLDADLGPSVREAGRLLEPVMKEEADMTVATFPKTPDSGGFGLVKGLARWGLSRYGGSFEAPLSGQRALRREVLAGARPLGRGFGIEVGLSIEALKRGYRILEVETHMGHRLTGRNLAGFLHRARQFWDVGRVFLAKAGRS